MGETDSRGIALIVRGKNPGFGNDDLGAVLKFFETAVGDHVSSIESLYLGHAGLADSRFDVMNMRDLILNEENIGHVAVVLNRGGRNQDHIFERIQQQASVHELVGKERA